MRLARLSLSAGVIAALLAGCSAPPRPVRAPGPEPTWRVMTYNVNFGIPGDGPTLAAIEAGNADIVFLQEVNTGWERALRPRFAAVFPYMALYPRAAAGGIGVMSRLPIREQKLILPEGDGWFPALRVVLDSPLGAVQVLVVHLRPPVSDGGSFVAGYFTTSGVRRRELESFIARLDPALPTLIVGDFNEADGQAMRFLAGRGLKSALPEFKPEAKTWHWPTSVMTFRDRLDHIVYDARLEPLAADVLYQGRSDHFPVISVIAPAQPAPR